MEQRLCELTIEITQKCPNRCLFCSSLASLDAKHELAVDDILKLCREAKDLGLERVSLSGGEPLLHPNINPICEKIHDLGLDFNLYTTGLCIDQQGTIGPCLDWSWFPKDGNKVIFNIQSTDEEVHDRLVGRKGSFMDSKAALLAVKKAGLFTEVHVVPNRFNFKGIPKAVTDLASWGADKISFLRFVPQGYGRTHRDSLLLDEEESKELRGIFAELAKKTLNGTSLRFGIPFSGLVEKPKECNAGERKLIIRYDGKVLPCEAFKDNLLTDYILGDIFDLSLSELLLIGSSNENLLKLKKSICQNETCPAQHLY